MRRCILARMARWLCVTVSTPLLLALVGSCVGDDPTFFGTEAAPCREGDTCDVGLLCVGNRCVIPDAGGTDGSVGAADGGLSADTGADTAPSMRVDPRWAVDLLAYWPFDVDGTDFGELGLDLSVSQDVVFETGAVGNAMRRQTNSDVRRATNDPALDLDSGDFSIQVWVSPEEPAGSPRAYLAKGIPTRGWSLGQAAAGFVYFSTTGSADAFNGPNLAPREWQHVVVVRAGNQGRIFVDGALVNSATLTSPPKTVEHLRVGQRAGSDTSLGTNVNGSLDEVAIWRRALSPPEVEELYNDGRGRSLLAP